jgi:hypothetical protein
MKTRIAAAGLLLALVQLAACGPTSTISDLVVINYTQAGNSDFIAAGKQITDGMFMRYHIDSISNNEANAQTFHFDPQKIFAQAATNRPFHHPCIAQDAIAADVPAHTVTTNELFGVTIKVPGDPASLKTSFVFINYTLGPGEHVVMTPSSTNFQPQPPPKDPLILPVPYKGDICHG